MSWVMPSWLSSDELVDLSWVMRYAELVWAKLRYAELSVWLWWVEICRVKCCVMLSWAGCVELCRVKLIWLSSDVLSWDELVVLSYAELVDMVKFRCVKLSWYDFRWVKFDLWNPLLRLDKKANFKSPMRNLA